MVGLAEEGWVWAMAEVEVADWKAVGEVVGEERPGDWVGRGA